MNKISSSSNAMVSLLKNMRGSNFMKVKLKDIMEELEIQFEESRSFLNIKTGEIVLVTSEDLRAAEDEEPFAIQWCQDNNINYIE